MTVTWHIKREVVNAETQLSKVAATATDSESGDIQTFSCKGRMQTDEEKKAVWDNVLKQYQDAEAIKKAVDSAVNEGETYLDGKGS